MKRLLTSLLIVVLLSLAFSSTVAAQGHIQATLITTRDGTQEDAAGFVRVWNDAENIYVRYWMRAGHCLLESHLHLATDLDDIPQGPGGAIPGQFEYQTKHDPCVTNFVYTIPLTDIGDEGVGARDTVFIAAQAVVRLPDGTVETAWGVNCGNLDAQQFPGANWSAYIKYHVK